MASRTDPIAPRTWVAIDTAKGVNVALVEHSDGREQRFRLVHQRDDYDRLVTLLRGCLAPCRIAVDLTGDHHRTIAFRLLSEGFEVVYGPPRPELDYAKPCSTPEIITTLSMLRSS